MKIEKLLLLCGLLVSQLLMISCNNKENQFREFYSSTELKGKRLALDSLLWNPTEMILLDSILIVNDHYNDQFASIISIKSGKLKKRFGIKGEGPGEVLHPINISRNENGILLYSRPLRSVVKYSWHDLQTESTQNPVSLMKFKNSIDKVVSLTDTTYIGIGPFDGNSRYIQVEGEGDDANFLEFRYPKNSSNLPNELNYLAFQANLSLKPDKSHFIAASIFSEQFEVFAIKDNRVTDKIYEFNNVNISWNDRSQGEFKQIEFLDDHETGFINVTTTDKYIYLLYAGRSKGEFKDKAFQSNTVLVYEWDGTPVIRYELDEDIYNLSVNSNNSLMCGLIRGRDPDIILYPLPKI